MLPSAGARSTLTFSDSNGIQVARLEKDSISIGRLPDQDIVLHEAFASRRHATINRIETGFELIDRNSSHGTWLNGLRVERAILCNGDILQFGSSAAMKIRLDIETPTPPPPTSGNLFSAISTFSKGSPDDHPVTREIEQLNFMLRAARKLNSGGAKREILQALLQISIQLTGVERGFVFLREGGEMRLALGLQSDGKVVDEDSTVSRRAMQRAIESAEKFSVSDTLADIETGVWGSIVANSIRCIYCVPLRKRALFQGSEQLFGLLYLDSQLYASQLNSIGHELLDAVATEGATLLENALLADAEIKARRAEEELAVAAKIHEGLMSMTLPQVPYAEIDARSVPCTAIGGDFFDVLELDGCLGAMIADISGKGLPASIVAATLQGIIHAQMLTGQGLEGIAALVNRFLCSRRVGKYATMVLLKLHPDGLVEYINCGHVRPLLVSGSTVRVLEGANLMVGLIAGATYTSAEVRLMPGDRILLATDGVTEAENSAEEQFGEERFESVAIHEGLEGIIRHVDAFKGSTPAQDDCTLLQVRYCPETSVAQV